MTDIDYNFGFDLPHVRIAKYGIHPVWDVAKGMAMCDGNILATRRPSVLIPAIIYKERKETWDDSMESLHQRLMEDFPVSSQPIITQTAGEISYNSCLFDQSEHGKGKKNQFQQYQQYIRMFVECSEVSWDEFKQRVKDDKRIEAWMPKTLHR